MRRIYFLLLFFVNLSFSQVDLMSNTAKQIDTTQWQAVRDRIKDQTSFINVNPTGENYFKRARLKAYLQQFEEAIEDLTRLLNYLQISMIFIIIEGLIEND